MSDAERESTEELPVRRSDLADAIHVDDRGRVRARARVHERLFGESEGQEFGRYRLIEAVGRGGMGTVWRAHDSKLGRDVAIKLLHDGALRRPLRARRQLLAEAALMAKLAHPNVVRVYDVGEFEGELFLAMELVRGKTLRTWQQQRSWRELVDVYRQAGAGLAAAHQANLVHGDFKPDNVLIGDDGRVLVTDFAMTRHVVEARLELELAGVEADTPAGESDDSDTRIGSTTSSAHIPLVKGTPAYMAPEQFDGEVADARSDQFSFCVALWEALAGERPFRGRNWTQLREAMDRGPRTPSERVGPRALWAALERGLKPKREDRWPTLDELLERLQWIQGRTRRWSLAGLGLGLTSLGFVAAIVQREPDPETVAIVQQCDPEQAASELAEAWSSERQQAIVTAFVASELPYAEPAAKTTIARLDEWTAAWTAARAEACTSGDDEAARLSLVCLDRNKDSFIELVDVLGETNPTTVEVAGELVELLPVASACAEFELPLDEQARTSDELAALSRLAAQVDRIEMLWLIGRLDDAMVLTEALMQEAEALDADGIIARGHKLRGMLRLDTGEREVALDELLTAALGARAAGLPKLEAQCWLTMAEAESRVGGSGAARWVTIAAPLVEQVDDPELDFDLANHRGFVAQASGKPAEALKWFEQALDLLEADEREFRRMQALNNIGVVLVNLDQTDRARAVMTELIEIGERNLPAGHPSFGMFYNGLAGVESTRGNYTVACEHYRRAHDILNATFGHDHIHTQSVRYQLALCKVDIGQCDEGRRLLDEMIPVLRKDPNSAVLLPSVLGWRSLLCNEVQPDSLALADEAVERAEQVFPAGSLGLAKILSHRAWLLLALDDYPGAERGFVAVLAILEAELSEGHIERDAALGGLWAARAGLGRADEARPMIEEAIVELGNRRPTRTEQLQQALAKLGPAK
ncbi:protein kinase domain-containing protein [Nannocystaceae bacterium ST9]